MGTEAQFEVEAEVGVQGDVVGEAELWGEAKLGSEAQLGGDDGAGQPNVVVEDVFDKDEGSSVDKLDDSEEERVADDEDVFRMDLSHLLEKLGLFWISGKQ